MRYKMVIIMDNRSELSSNIDIKNIKKFVKWFYRQSIFMLYGTPCMIFCRTSKVSSFNLTPIREATCPDNQKMD